MTALINILDNYTSQQIGEKGHVEYGWSNNIREKILQFSFQLTRTTEQRVNGLKAVLCDLLTTLKYHITSSSNLERDIAKGYLSILYRMIGHTRDIVDGKGEYTLTYMMIYTWYDFYPELALFALRCLVDIGNKNIHPYGSWKDMKYFCQYCKSNGENIAHPLIQYIIRLVNDQLKNDYSNYISNTNNISLLAKWVPREKSTFGWLYRELATDFFSHFLLTASSDTQFTKAVLKCKTEYRKLLSGLNKHIETLQIKQCSKKWTTINFGNITSISLTKQKKALLNIKQNGDIRFPDSMDRIDCAKKFSDHIKRAADGEFELKGKRIGMADFTKQAIQLIHSDNQIEIDLLNSQWRDNASQCKELGKMIAMVDVSGSMEGDPMNAAIALGIRIAEKSILGKRVMAFSAKPTWVNLDGYNDFVSQVKIIKGAEWGMNTNFYSALDTILDAIIQNKMAPEDVQDLVLVILSDMQIDSGDTSDTQALYDIMKEKYTVAGIRVHGKPYKPPHILFWNLRSTSGFPTLSNQRNCSMMSGFSPSLLNIFCDQGVNALQACTPWSLLEKCLENERYKIMADKFSRTFDI
jgi:hypothetical protein